MATHLPEAPQSQPGNLCPFTTPPINNWPVKGPGVKCRLCTARSNRHTRCNATQTTGCHECVKYGLPCVIGDWALPPPPGRQGGQASSMQWTACTTCLTNDRCDRSHPCQLCIDSGQEATCARHVWKGLFYRPVPGDDMYGYFVSLGFGRGPNGVRDRDFTQTWNTFRQPDNYHVELAYNIYNANDWLSQWGGPQPITQGAPEVLDPQGPIYIGPPNGMQAASEPVYTRPADAPVQAPANPRGRGRPRRDGQPSNSASAPPAPPPGNPATGSSSAPPVEIPAFRPYRFDDALTGSRQLLGNSFGSSVGWRVRPVPGFRPVNNNSSAQRPSSRSVMMDTRSLEPPGSIYPPIHELPPAYPYSSNIINDAKGQMPYPVEIDTSGDVIDPETSGVHGIGDSTSKSLFLKAPDAVAFESLSPIDQTTHLSNTPPGGRDPSQATISNMAQSSTRILPNNLAFFLNSPALRGFLDDRLENRPLAPNNVVGPQLLQLALSSPQSIDELLARPMPPEVDHRLIDPQIMPPPNQLPERGVLADIPATNLRQVVLQLPPLVPIPPPQPLGHQPTNPDMLISQNPRLFTQYSGRIRKLWGERIHQRPVGDNNAAMRYKNKEIKAWLNPTGMLVQATADSIEKPPSPGSLFQIFTHRDQPLPHNHPAREVRGRPALPYIPKNRTWAEGALAPLANLCSSCEKYTHGICENIEHHAKARCFVCADCAQKSRTEAYRLLTEFKAFVKLRRFCCRECTARLLNSPQCMEGSGTEVYDLSEVTDYDTRVITNNWFDAEGVIIRGGVHRVRPDSGCACVEKLIDRRLCNAHRCQGFFDLINRMYAMSAYKALNHGVNDVCFGCMENRPQYDDDADNLEEAGRAWGCLACSGIVIGPTPDSIKVTLDMYPPYMDVLQNETRVILLESQRGKPAPPGPALSPASDVGDHNNDDEETYNPYVDPLGIYL